ncbi:MAG: CopD family protein, partial [Ilumatobacteraceae bacterium]
RIPGASVCHIGAPSAAGVPVVDAGADDLGWGVRFGASLLGAVAYAGALIGVGGWWWLVLLAGRRDDERLAAPAEPAWRMVVGRALVLGAVALIAALPFRIAKIGGGLDALRDDDLLWASLRGPIGVATAVTAVALLATAGLMGRAHDRRDVGWLAAATGAVALAGFAIEGHTRSQHPLALMIGFDAIHLAAAALWIGGVAGLVVAFRSEADATSLGRMVARFSRAAVVSVVVLSIAGIGMAWIVLPSLDDLVSTGWGLALLTKVALVAVVVALGAYNNRRLVPVVSTGTATATTSAGARRRLARIVQVELVLLLAVVAVTAVLVGRSPVGTGQAAPPPAAVPADAVELSLSNGAGTASVAVAPARAGSNEIRLMLLDAAGQPLDPVDTPTVELTEPTLQLGPLRPVVHVIGAGDFHVIADVPIAGSWELTIRVRVSDFDAATATTVVEIAP